MITKLSFKCISRWETSDPSSNTHLTLPLRVVVDSGCPQHEVVLLPRLLSLRLEIEHRLHPGDACLAGPEVLLGMKQAINEHLPRKQWVRLNHLCCGTARVGDTMKLWGPQESAMGACGQHTQSVQHVVVDRVTHKAPEGFAGLRRLDAATRTCFIKINIAI